MGPDSEPTATGDDGPGAIFDRAETLITQSRWQAVVDLLGPVFHQARIGGDNRAVVRSGIILGRANSRMEHHVAAAESLRIALMAAQDLADPPMAADVLRFLAVAHHRAGDVSVARELLDEALRIVDDTGLENRRGGIQLEIGNACYATQQYTEAEKRYQEALRHPLGLEDELRLLCNLAMTYCDIGRFEEAIAPANRARERAIAANTYPHLRNSATGTLGRARAATGDVVGGLRLLGEAVHNARIAGDRLGLTNSLLWRGEILERTRHRSEAMAAYQEAFQIAGQRQSPYDVCTAAQGLSRLELAAGNHATARRWAFAALEAAERSEGAAKVREAREQLARIPPAI